VTIHTPAPQKPKAPAHDHPPEVVRLDDGSFLLGLKRGKRVVHVTRYRVRRLKTDWGYAGWELRKLNEDGTLDAIYHALHDGSGWACDCPGGAWVGKCRHVAALVALSGEGKLP
jgi:hypothetical protein